MLWVQTRGQRLLSQEESFREEDSDGGRFRLGLPPQGLDNIEAPELVDYNV